jgi:hypothetical protein
MPFTASCSDSGHSVCVVRESYRQIDVVVAVLRRARIALDQLAWAAVRYFRTSAPTAVPASIAACVSNRPSADLDP